MNTLFGVNASTIGYLGAVPLAGSAAVSTAFASNGGETSYVEDAMGMVPAAGAERSSIRLLTLPAGGPLFSGGPASLRNGRSDPRINTLVDRMVSLASDTRLAPPMEMAKQLEQIIEGAPRLYGDVASRLLRSTRDREGENRSQTVGFVFESLYKGLPAKRVSFVQVFLWRLHGLFEEQNALSPNQMRIIKKMVEGKPEWAAEVVNYIRASQESLDAFQRKIAVHLDISLARPERIDWDSLEG